MSTIPENSASALSGLIAETVARCPLCEHTESSLFQHITFKGILLAYRICSQCGLVYQSPRIPEELLPDFYATQYRALYLGQSTPRTPELQIQERRAAHLVDFLQKKDPTFKPHYHLDIVCGSGALLEAIRTRFNCKAIGIEPDNAHREFVMKNGLEAYATLDHWLNDTAGEKPNLISLSHVLEHLTDPVGYLSRLRTTALDPEGRLLIEVPNLYCHNAFEIAHPFAFSATTLRAVLGKAGFVIVGFKMHGVPVRKSPLYLTALALPHPEATFLPILSDRHPKFRRRLGRALVETERMGLRVWHIVYRITLRLRRISAV